MSVAQKVAFAQVMQNHANTLAQTRWGLHVAHLLYNSRGWQPGGGDAILDSEIASLNITAAQLKEFVETVEEHLDQMMNNEATAAFDGEARVNAVRNDM